MTSPTKPLAATTSGDHMIGRSTNAAPEAESLRRLTVHPRGLVANGGTGTLIFAGTFLLVALGPGFSKLSLLGSLFVAELLLLGTFANPSFLTRAARLTYPRWIIAVIGVLVVQLCRIVLTPGFVESAPQMFRRVGIYEFVLFAFAGYVVGFPNARRLRAMVVGAGQLLGILSVHAYLSGTFSFTITGSERYLGSTQAFGAAAVLAFIWTVDADKTLRYKMASSALPLTCLYLVYQRSVWLAGAVTIVTAHLAAPSRERRRRRTLRRKYATAGGTCVAVAVLLIAPQARLFAEDAAGAVTGVRIEDDANVAYRLSVQTEQWQAWLNDPLLGTGYDTAVQRRHGGTIEEAHGHNSTVTALYRGGLLGLIPLAGLYLAAIRRGLTSHNPLLSWTASVMVGAFVGSLFNVWFEVPYLAPLIWLLAGASLRTTSR